MICVKIYRVKIDTYPGDDSIMYPLVNAVFYYKLNIYVLEQIRCAKGHIYVKKTRSWNIYDPIIYDDE